MDIQIVSNSGAAYTLTLHLADIYIELRDVGNLSCNVTHVHVTINTIIWFLFCQMQSEVI